MILFRNSLNYKRIMNMLGIKKFILRINEDKIIFCFLLFVLGLLFIIVFLSFGS